MKEVEILKLGTRLGTGQYTSSLKTSRYVSTTKPLIMVVKDGGPIFDHYITILKSCKDYSYLNCEKSIIGRPFPWVNILTKGRLDWSVAGIPDHKPEIGKNFTINRYWHTSKVQDIIGGCVLITENSVYAIHDLSELRKDKLDQLGI